MLQSCLLDRSQTPGADGRTRDETAEPADEAADLHLDGRSLHSGVYKSQQLDIILAHCITNVVPAVSFCCSFTLSVQSGLLPVIILD